MKKGNINHRLYQKIRKIDFCDYYPGNITNTLDNFYTQFYSPYKELQKTYLNTFNG